MTREEENPSETCSLHYYTILVDVPVFIMVNQRRQCWVKIEIGRFCKISNLALNVLSNGITGHRDTGNWYCNKGMIEIVL